MRRINKYIPISIQNYFHERKGTSPYEKEFRKWELEGSPVPPPHLAKQKIIERYSKQYKCEILIETGTYLGDTVFSQKENFKRIISIELSDKLHKAAERRFRKYAHINILKGNSGDLLPFIMPDIKERSLLWLDGHFSGGATARGEKESPIFRELDAVFSNNNLLHIILIDDARLFVGKRDYPTFDELKDYVRTKNPDYKISVETDIIILTIK